MSLVNHCPTRWLSLIAVLAAGHLTNAQAQERPNGFYLTTPFEYSAGYDSGFSTGTRTLSDSVQILSGPTFNWIENTHRTDVTISYQPDFELFSRYTNLDSWNHAAKLRLTHRINSRWTLDAGDSFVDTTDPTRALMNSLLLLPRGTYLENDAYIGVGYRLDQYTKVRFRFDNSTDIIDLTGDLRGRLNDTSSAMTITLDRSLTQTQDISADYAFLYVTPLHSELSGGSTHVQLVNVVYSWAPQRGLLLRLAGGGVEASQPAATGSVEVEKSIGSLWAAAGYERYVGFFGGLNPVGGGPSPETIAFTNGITPDAVYDVASFRLWGQVSKRTALEATAQRALNGETVLGQGIKSVIGHARVTYKLNDRVSLFAEGDYYGQNVNRFLGEPLSETRAFAGIQITLSRPPETQLPNKPPDVRELCQTHPKKFRNQLTARPVTDRWRLVRRMINEVSRWIAKLFVHTHASDEAALVPLIDPGDSVDAGNRILHITFAPALSLAGAGGRRSGTSPPDIRAHR